MSARDLGLDATSDLPTWRSAAIVSVALSVLFMVVYNAANWITSQRSDVGTLYFAWERHVPFVPAMIVPYMSIDLFFVIAPFLCRDRRELRVFSRRVMLAIALAGASFLLFPLTLAVERPHVDGALGAVFNWFRGVDLPYNLCPSLHIALRTILAALYARYARGIWLWASHLWFSLIGLSTLLTYQHHVIDVAGGFVLAAVCFYVVREQPFRLPVKMNIRIGSCIAVGSALAAAGAWWLRPWGWLLIWPVVALALNASAYCWAGPGIFRKSNGRIPLSARLLLEPLLLGHYLSLWYYRRQCDAWNMVTDRVWIGRRLNDREAAGVIRSGVTAVVDLTGEFSEAQPFLDVEYLHLPVLDLTPPSPQQLQEAGAFINEQTRSGIVYVHCKIGYSRSAAVVGTWLVQSGLAHSADEAIAWLRRVRPSIVIRPEAETAIRSAMRATPVVTGALRGLPVSPGV
jgi:membrane-associated phospholipid phosphatase